MCKETSGLQIGGLQIYLDIRITSGVYVWVPFKILILEYIEDTPLISFMRHNLKYPPNQTEYFPPTIRSKAGMSALAPSA